MSWPSLEKIENHGISNADEFPRYIRKISITQIYIGNELSHILQSIIQRNIE